MFAPHRPWPLAFIACLLAGVASAQTRIASVPQPAGPSTATRSSFALPNAAGLSPGAGAGTAVGADASVTLAPTTTGGIANANRASGTAASGSSAVVAGTNGRYSEADIARSFLEADIDRNGELTRDEAARLLIAPADFQSMDRDGNGVITRFEYQYATH